MDSYERYLALFASILTVITSFITFFLLPSQYKYVGYFIVLLLIQFLILRISFNYGKRNSKINNNSDSIDNSIISIFRTLKANNKNADIVRIGLALKSTLWLSHKYHTMKLIGEYIEDAATTLENINATIIVLIDFLGWINVELGFYSEGEDKIKLGLDLAEKNKDYYYLAKAYRHLYGLYIRQGKIIAAEQYLTKSREITEKLPFDKKREELIAKLHFASSGLEFKKGNLEKSFKEIEILHEKYFKEINIEDQKYKPNHNEEWIIKILSMKGEILLNQGKLEEAYQIFKKGLYDSERHQLNRQIVKNLIGLGLYFYSRKQLDRSKIEFEKAKILASEIGMYYDLQIINNQLEIITNKI